MTLFHVTSESRFKEYIPSSPATGLGIFSFLDINRSLNLRYWPDTNSLLPMMPESVK